MPLTPSETILNGKYHIQRLIGEGGMARVWSAEEVAFTRFVAIKELRHAGLRPQDAEEEEQRFGQEIEMAAMLEKAHVPQVIRALTLERIEDGSRVLVMEYAAGGSLAEKLVANPGGLPFESVLLLANEICRALKGFHALPLMPVHRDIKPSNILFDSTGSAYLADFGLCQLTGRSGRSQLQAGAHPGTPLYMSPEQARSPEPLNPAADLYSLGCVLFEMLTGKSYKRFRPGTLASSMNPSVPKWLDEVLVKALAEDPFDRYQSAEEMEQALQTGVNVIAQESAPKQEGERSIALENQQAEERDGLLAQKRKPAETQARSVAAIRSSVTASKPRLETVAEQALPRVGHGTNAVQPTHTKRNGLIIAGSILIVGVIIFLVLGYSANWDFQRLFNSASPTTAPNIVNRLATTVPTTVIKAVTPIPTRGNLTGDTTYKIAIVVPLSGDVKTFGESALNGAMMAIDAARVAGMRIDVVVADSKCDAQEATNAANKVISQDNVHYIIGEVCSSASIPMSTIAEANKVLMISPTSTNPAITVNEDGSVKQYVFRACFLDPFQGEVIAALAMELGAKKMAVFYDVGNDYVKGLAEYAKASFEKAGGTVPVYEAYTKDDTDFSTVLGKVADAQVDVLVLPDYYSKVNLIAQQVRDLGIAAILLGGDGWDSPDLNLGLLEGAYFTNHYSPFDPRPVVQDFVKTYKAKFGVVPDVLAALAYDSAMILIQSIKDAGVDDPTVVAQKMAAIKFTGVSGDISFNAQHNPIKKAAVMKISGGRVTFFKFVGP